MCCISKPWWLKVQQMSGSESSYFYISVRMKLKRTSVPSVTCCLPSSVIWLKGKDASFSRHQNYRVWFLLFWIVFRKIVVTLYYKYFLATSSDKSEFMRECEKNYSMWTFSGGFRTWVKMSLVRTSGKGNESVEFRQEVGNDLIFNISFNHKIVV